MTASLLKTLDALDAALKAATPGPWDTGDGGCGPYLSFNGHPPGGGLDEPYDDGSEPLWLGGRVNEADRKCIVAAVNALPMLLRIARAAAARVEAERLYAFAVATEAVDLDALCEAKDAAESTLIAALDAATEPGK